MTSTNKDITSGDEETFMYPIPDPAVTAMTIREAEAQYIKYKTLIEEEKHGGPVVDLEFNTVERKKNPPPAPDLPPLPSGNYLLSYAPDDVLTKFEKYGKSHVSLSLRDVCTIEVVDLATRNELEASFPALSEAPADKTGLYSTRYWFLRSEKADVDGLYSDIPCPWRPSGVEFRSRRHDGSITVSDAIIVADDQWIRPLGTDAMLSPIPSDLLVAVAASAIGPARTRRFVFENTENTRDLENPVVEMTVRGLESFSYFEPFIDEETFFADVIPVPCAETDFMTALYLATTLSNDLNVDLRTDEIRAALIVADKLGCVHDIKMRLISRLWHHDMARSWPEMADALAREKANPSDVLPIDAVICYEPRLMGRRCQNLNPNLNSKKDEFPQFLGKDLKRYNVHDHNETPRERPNVGDVVVDFDLSKDEDLFKKALPKIVATLMCEHPLVLAGGAMLGAIAYPVVTKGADWDLFVHGIDDDAVADAMLAKIRATHFSSKHWQTIRTTNAWTFVHGSLRKTKLTIQIVLRLYEKPEHVMGSFDLAPCKVGAWFEEDEGYDRKLVVRASPSWFEAMKCLEIAVDPFNGTWGWSSVSRIVKYAAKGFDIAVPCVRDEFLGDTLKFPKRGLAGLLYVGSRLETDEMNMGSANIHKTRKVLHDLLFGAAYDLDDLSDHYNSTYTLRGTLRQPRRITKYTTDLETKNVWHRFVGGRSMRSEDPRIFAVHGDRASFERKIMLELFG